MNDLDTSILNFFSWDYDAARAIGAVLNEGCPACQVSEFISEYCEQVLAVFPLHLVHWDAIAERLIMEHLGAQQEGAHDPSIPEWDERFDSNEY